MPIEQVTAPLHGASDQVRLWHGVQVGWQAVEAAFWQIVEEGEEPVEVIYGADLDSTQLGSGFPCVGGRLADHPAAQSPWNLNNIPRMAGVTAHHRWHLNLNL